MNNVLYYAVTRGIKDSPDGETPSVLHVTEENNGYHVWFTSFEAGRDHLKWFDSPNAAIEYGVDTARRLKAAADYAKEAA